MGSRSSAGRWMLRNQFKFAFLLVAVLTLTSFLAISKMEAPPAADEGGYLLAMAREGVAAALAAAARPPPADAARMRGGKGALVLLKREGRVIAAAGRLFPDEAGVDLGALVARLAFEAASGISLSRAAAWGTEVEVFRVSEVVECARGTSAFGRPGEGLLVRRGVESWWVAPGDVSGNRVDLLEEGCWRSGLGPGAWRAPPAGVKFLFFRAQAYKEGSGQ